MTNDDEPRKRPDAATGHAAATTRIRDLNDELRRSLSGGRIMMTASVAARDPVRIAALLDRLRNFDAFTPDNDPHGEHDFGVIEDGGERFLWKIDYYDKRMEFASPNPADPAVTTRVLTLMRAEDY